jgi:hypothetical protein
MADKQYVYNQQVITVPDGQTPPVGAIPLGGGGGTGTTNSFNFQDAAGGLSSDVFAQAQAAASSGGNITIPIWRTRDLNEVPIGHTDSSANALEHSMGSRKNSSANAVEHGGGPTTVKLPSQLNEDQAITQFATILGDPDLYASWAQIALEAGLVSPDKMNDAVALGEAWKQAVAWAINFKAASNGTVELTPFEAAQKVAQNTGSALLAQQAYAAAHFTGDKTFTQTTTNEQDAPEQMLHDLLGRNPTKGELAAYQHGVASVAKAHPTTTTTTDHYQDGEHVSRHDVITGGYDERQAQIDAAYAATPEVAANQQATTYYNALVQALQSAV